MWQTAQNGSQQGCRSAVKPVQVLEDQDGAIGERSSQELDDQLLDACGARRAADLLSERRFGESQRYDRFQEWHPVAQAGGPAEQLRDFRPRQPGSSAGVKVDRAEKYAPLGEIEGGLLNCCREALQHAKTHRLGGRGKVSQHTRLADPGFTANEDQLALSPPKLLESFLQASTLGLAPDNIRR